MAKGLGVLSRFATFSLGKQLETRFGKFGVRFENNPVWLGGMGLGGFGWMV